jgi:hypothetical protein
MVVDQGRISAIQPRDVWHMIESGHYFSYRDFEIRGLTPSHP